MIEFDYGFVRIPYKIFINSFFTKGETSMKNTNDFERSKRMWWIVLTLMVVGSLLLSGCGAKEPKVYKVGVLAGISFVADIVDGFKEGMAELGYVEGENIEYDVQSTEFDMAAYESIVKKFVEDDVDLILVFPTEATMVAKEVAQGSDVPVLFTFALVEGCAIPGRISPCDGLRSHASWCPMPDE